MNDYSQLSTEAQLALHKQFLEEPDSFYEKAEMDQLRAALARTYEERFFVMPRLMKQNSMFSNAKITHKTYPSNKS